MTGLPVSRLISVGVNLSPSGAQFANLSTLLIIGDSDVIDTASRVRAYATIDAVAADFGTGAAEYKAALLYFAQTPQPTNLLIGKWARVATAGRLLGGLLTTAQQALANFTGITTGAFKIQVDAGALTAVSAMNFTGAATMTAVAAIIQAAITTAAVGATCVWDSVNSRFVFKSNTTGAASKVLPLAAPAAGVDITGLLNGTVATGAVEVDGIVAETALACVTIMDALTTPWYGLTFASSTMPVDADNVAVSAYIEAASNIHTFGVPTQAAAALDPTSTTDIAYLLGPLGTHPKRTFVHYSSSTPYAPASFFGRALTVDFTANSSVITLMFKNEPSIVAEVLTVTQANALKAKRCNVFVAYNNATAIIQDGTMGGDAYFDEVIGTDWFANAIQVGCFNLLLSANKVPQTDSGNNQIMNAIETVCAQAVANGLLAAGIWTAGGFGQLVTGQFLAKGFYVYTPPISTQASADRAARKSVAFQVAAKLAGAIQSVNVIVNVNR